MNILTSLITLFVAFKWAGIIAFSWWWLFAPALLLLLIAMGIPDDYLEIIRKGRDTKEK